ncbi:MAG: hypothetical protein PWR30_435 [Candidatus Woesearchaeota archaeon]|nr:hypothetical protein [Candidatus Woesearchaeota archaeon]
MDYTDMFMQLEAVGLFDVFLPFLLIFSLAFMVANLMPHMGRKNAGIFALVVSLLSVATHVIDFGVGIDVVEFINSVLPGIAALLIGIIAIFFVLGLVAPKAIESSNKWFGLIAGLIALVIVIIGLIQQAPPVSGPSWYWWNSFLNWLTAPENIAWIAMIIAFVASIWFITSEGKDKGGKSNDGSPQVVINQNSNKKDKD